MAISKDELTVALDGLLTKSQAILAAGQGHIASCRRADHLTEIGFDRDCVDLYCQLARGLHVQLALLVARVATEQLTVSLTDADAPLERIATALEGIAGFQARAHGEVIR